ncbi:MAG: hypothetical protein AB7T38_12665 [Nitrospirales bacterium]
MKIPAKPTRLVESNQPRPSTRKKRRRHTRIHLEALRPPTAIPTMESLSCCPKCQGLIYVDGGETLTEKVIRCLNCGWQPYHRFSQFEEPEEARTMRALTIQIGSYDDDRTQSVNF